MSELQETILETAERLVYGNRQASYGHPRANFTHTVGLINAQFAHKLKDPFTPAEFAILMILCKLSRLKNSPDHLDSMIDIAGYIATYSRVLFDPDPEKETRGLHVALTDDPE